MSEPLVVNVRVADAEPVKHFVKGAAEAAEMFAALSDAERDVLPDAALYGIARLRGAIAELIGEEPPQERLEQEPLRGAVIIEWRARNADVVRKYGAMVGAECAVFAAETGEPIATCTGIVVHAVPASIATADLTVLADADGNPLLGAGSEPVMDPAGKEFLTGTFTFAVAAMRIRKDAG